MQGSSSDNATEKTRDLAQLGGLMKAAQDGDGSAYAALLKKVTPWLRQMVRHHRRFLQPQDVEDIVQDILLSLHAVRATYDPKRPFLPWLAAIARNRLADSARRYARRAASEVGAQNLTVTFADEETKLPMDAYGDSEALRHAIEALPRGQRQAVELLKLRELSLKEAAHESGMTVGALKVAVHRGIRALRKALGKET
jgi:RNA polymerase sigma factor (sigma-70 family)